jgi:hypothetical protein
MNAALIAIQSDQYQRPRRNRLQVLCKTKMTNSVQFSPLLCQKGMAHSFDLYDGK